MVWEIKQEHEKCIGCGACVAVDPDHWEIDDSSGRAVLKGSKTLDDEHKTQVLDVEDPGKAQEAADMCPVTCIFVNKK